MRFDSTTEIGRMDGCGAFGLLISEDYIEGQVINNEDNSYWLPPETITKLIIITIKLSWTSPPVYSFRFSVVEVRHCDKHKIKINFWGERGILDEPGEAWTEEVIGQIQLNGWFDFSTHNMMQFASNKLRNLNDLMTFSWLMINSWVTATTRRSPKSLEAENQNVNLLWSILSGTGTWLFHHKIGILLPKEPSNLIVKPFNEQCP